MKRKQVIRQRRLTDNQNIFKRTRILSAFERCQTNNNKNYRTVCRMDRMETTWVFLFAIAKTEPDEHLICLQ